MAHLLVVTGLVIEDGGDEDQAIAALLHDAVEDAGGRPMLERIERSFGERVADQLWYYGALLEFLSHRRPGPLTEDLRRGVDGLRMLVEQGAP